MLIRFAIFLALGTAVLPVGLFSMIIRSGGSVVLNEPVWEDVYIAGGTVKINAPVYGDIIVAGGAVFVNDTIQGDVLVAGGEVTLGGYVADDVRVAGGQVVILTEIGGDMLVWALRVILDKNARVTGDLAVRSGDARLDGLIGRTVNARCGKLELGGQVGADADLLAGYCTISGIIRGDARFSGESLAFSEDGKIAGRLRYRLPEEIEGLAAHTGAGAVFDPTLPGFDGGEAKEPFGWTTIGAFFWYLGSMILVIGLLIFFFPLWLRRAARLTARDPVQMLTTGFLFLLAFPAIGIILVLTLLGIPVGVFLLAAFALMLSLSNVLTASLTAFWIRERYNFQWPTWKMILAAASILLLLRLLYWIPYTGWLTKLLAVCLTFGALYNAFKERRLEGGFSF